MPHMPEMRIVRAWRYATQPDRIHYTVKRPDGSIRHLREPNESEWGKILDEWLRDQGYEMPKSAAS